MSSQTDLPKRMTEAEKDAFVAHQKELVKPQIGLDFLDSVVIEWGSQALYDWLKVNAPEPVFKMFEAIERAHCLLEGGRQLTDQLPREYDDELPDIIMDALRGMSFTGFQW